MAPTCACSMRDARSPGVISISISTQPSRPMRVRLVLMLASAASLRPSPTPAGCPGSMRSWRPPMPAGCACAARSAAVCTGPSSTCSPRSSSARSADPTPPLDALYEQALTAVYRILFLCFAEARGLVPTWHPVYRDGYTDRVDARRSPSARTRPTISGKPSRPSRVCAPRLRGRRPARHARSTAGLFAPARAPLLERRGLSGRKVRDVVLALSTTRLTRRHT